MASSTRLHEQAADTLRADIAAGRLKTGDRLPSIRELTGRFGMASETIRKALAVLADEGLIQSNSTRGYFVTDTVTSPLVSTDSRVDELARQVAELNERVSTLESELAAQSRS